MTFKEFLDLEKKKTFSFKVKKPHVAQQRKPLAIKPASPISYDKKSKWNTNFKNRFLIRGNKKSGIVL